MVWDRARIGDLVKPLDRRETVLPTEMYSLLGMRSNIRGAFLRETRRGDEISAGNLNKVCEGDLIYSRLFAWQGSFGLVPKNLSGCFVSSEFPIFDVDRSKADPRFLIYWFGLPSTQSRVKRDCYGSTPGTRNRFKEEFFYELEVPLPSLDEQQAIVRRLDAVQAKLNERQSELTAVKHDANAMLLNAFQEIIESVDHRPLSEVAPLHRRPVEIEPDIEYPELGARSFGRGLFHKPSLLGSNITWQKLFWIHEGDVVFSNIKAWEGAFGVATADDHLRVGSHRYLTCVPKSNIISSHFLWYYLQSEEGLEKVGAASPGSADRNRTLGQKALMAIQVPVPEIGVQRRFVELWGLVSKIRSIRTSTAKDVETLIPAMLHEIFERQAAEAKTSSAPSEAVIVQLPAAQAAAIDTPFKEAVLVGAVVKAFHEDNGQPIGNFRLQKAVYFARRHMGESALDKEYLRKAAGPYNPTMRYAGGFKIATKKNWIQSATGNYGKGSAPGRAAAEMEEWIERYRFAPAAAWVRDHFKFKPNDIWERMATVDYVMLALEHKGLRATPEAVLSYIENDSEWGPKVKKLRLTEASVQNVIAELQSLFAYS